MIFIRLDGKEDGTSLGKVKSSDILGHWVTIHLEILVWTYDVLRSTGCPVGILSLMGLAFGIYGSRAARSFIKSFWQGFGSDSNLKPLFDILFTAPARPATLRSQPGHSGRPFEKAL
jgi:hypothetical protein